MIDFLRQAWLIAWHDLRINLRQKETLMWAFCMPPLFFWFIGTVVGGFSGGDSGPPIALRGSDSAGFVADELAARLEAGGMLVRRFEGQESAESDAPFDDYRRRLDLPAQLTERILGGESVPIEFKRREAGLGADLDVFRVQRATYGVLADMVALAADGQEITAEAMQEMRTRERSLSIEVSAAGHLNQIPQGFQLSVPSSMVMFTLIVLLTSCATNLIGERRSGALLRLAASPIPRGSVVTGKWLGSLLLGGLQTGFAALLGTLAFGVDWGPQWPMVIVIVVAYAALVASLSILLGSLAKSEGQAVGLAVIAGNAFGALGGCWWPIEITPPFMQDLALFLPTGITMDALHRLMSYGQPAVDVLPHAAVLLVAAALCGWIATRVFRFE